MYILTADDVKAIRKATRVCVYLRRSEPKGKVRFIQENGLIEKETILPIPVTEYKKGPYLDGKYGINGENFSAISLYPTFSTKTPATTAFLSLKAGDEVSFEFYADAHTNAYMANAGLHGDTLLLYVKRKGGIFSFEVDSSACPENSARMSQGVPFPEVMQNLSKHV